MAAGERQRPKEGHHEHQGTRNDPASKARVDRTAAWVFALILAVLFTVSLIATTDPGTSVQRAPAAPTWPVGEPGAGGPSTVNGDVTPKGTAWQPIVISDSICHQCR